MDGYIVPDAPLGTWRDAGQAALVTGGLNLAGTAAVRAVAEAGSGISEYAPLIVGALQFLAGAAMKRPVLAAAGGATGLVVFTVEKLRDRQARKILGV